MVNEQNGALGHIGVAAKFNLIMLAMRHTLGDLSGTHLDPAVTIGFASTSWMCGCRLGWST